MNKVGHYDNKGNLLIEEVKLHKTGLYYRPDTSDNRMIRDSFKDYPTVECEDKIIMDCGANIGAFSVLAAQNKAKKVYAYEPESSNFKMMKLNADKYANIDLINCAVSNSNESQLSFYINKSHNAMCSGALNPRGKKNRVEMKVWNVNFWKEIERTQASLIKMDIEGGEYELFEGDFVMPECVKELAIEIHSGSTMEGLFDRLTPIFPDVVHKEIIRVFNKPQMMVTHLRRP